MATEMSTLDAMARVHIDQVQTIRSELEDWARIQWGALGNYRDADIARLVDDLIPRVQAGQLQTAEMTRAYMSAALEEIGAGVTAGPVDPAKVLTSRGVPASEVYQRPANTVYTALSNGADLEEAIRRGAVRLVQIIDGDIQLARRAQADASMRDSNVKLYRRILTGSENCALCTIASTQLYSKEKLMPIHPGCDCAQGPIPEGKDPGDYIDGDILERAHAAVLDATGTADRGGRNVDYRKTMLSSEGGNLRVAGQDVIKVREHGEYGPTLTWGKHDFTGKEHID